MDTDAKELENKDYVENVIMKPMGLASRPLRLHRVGVFTYERALKERYRPLKVSLQIKSQFLQNLSRLKGQFIKITEDLTKQERILVKEWQDKANNKNEKNTTRDTNGVLGEAHEVGCTLKSSFVKI